MLVLVRSAFHGQTKMVEAPNAFAATFAFKVPYPVERVVDADRAAVYVSGAGGRAPRPVVTATVADAFREVREEVEAMFAAGPVVVDVVTQDAAGAVTYQGVMGVTGQGQRTATYYGDPGTVVGLAVRDVEAGRVGPEFESVPA